MRLDNPVNARTQEGARQLIQDLAAHYARSGEKGRVVFTRDARQNITGTDRSRGFWARLSTVATNKYANAKTEFQDMVRLAWPDKAERIIAHMENRQHWQTGVKDMLTPGMIRAAVQLAQDLDDVPPLAPALGQMMGWPAGERVSDALTEPNGQQPENLEIAAAVGLIANGNRPALALTGNPLDDAPLKFMRRGELAQPRNYTACHETAVQLQDLMGVPGTERQSGGAGIDARRRGCEAVIDTLTVGTPCIIHMKAHTSPGPDGHSFSLVMRPDGRVDVLEAWASSRRGMDLANLLQQCRTGLPKARVIQAVRDIGSSDPAVRTRGYTYLSTAYSTSARYELSRDPRRDPRTGRETENVERLRAPDPNIRLDVTVRDLRPRQEVMDRMEGRLQELDQYVQDLRYTAPERQALRHAGMLPA